MKKFLTDDGSGKVIFLLFITNLCLGRFKNRTSGCIASRKSSWTHAILHRLELGACKHHIHFPFHIGCHPFVVDKIHLFLRYCQLLRHSNNDSCAFGHSYFWNCILQKNYSTSNLHYEVKIRRAGRAKEANRFSWMFVQ